MAFAGKVAIVTGGSKGIGRSVVERLVRDGAKVVINYSSDDAAAESLVESLGGSDKVIALKGDAGNVSYLDTLVAQTVAAFGKIDILIPCAGVLPMKTLESTTEEDFDRAFAVNVKGPMFLAKKVVPHMPSGSHIIFISTTINHASFVAPTYMLYCATKGAIEQMTRITAKELAPKGIFVNAVAPGPTGTELFLRGKPESLIQTMEGFSPFNRLGKPEDIAEAIAYLAGSSWVAGQTIRVNGGVA